MTLEEVRTLAFDLLERRAWTKRGLFDRLVRRGAAPEQAEAVLARLVEMGYLDDAAFARRWTESRARLRPVGPRRLRQELTRHGVPPAEAADAVRDVGPDAFVEQAERLARERWTRLLAAGADAAAAARKVAAFLARRGYDWETIRRALRRAGADA